MPFILHFSGKFSSLASEQYPTIYTAPQPAINPLYPFLNRLNSRSKVDLEGEIVNTKGPLVRFLTFPGLLSQDTWIIIVVFVYLFDCVIPLAHLLPLIRKRLEAFLKCTKGRKSKYFADRYGPDFVPLLLDRVSWSVGQCQSRLAVSRCDCLALAC